MGVLIAQLRAPPAPASRGLWSKGPNLRWERCVLMTRFQRRKAFHLPRAVVAGEPCCQRGPKMAKIVPMDKDKDRRCVAFGAKFADRGGDLRDLLVAVRAPVSGVGDQRRAPAPNNRLA